LLRRFWPCFQLPSVLANTILVLWDCNWCKICHAFVTFIHSL